MKAVLSIQSQVAGARVGNSVAGFAMERLGVPVIAMPTAILGRRPDRGAPGGGPIPATVLTTMLEALDADGALANVSHVLSGYIALPEQAEVILEAVRRVKAASPGAQYVCDPVMGDAGAMFVKPEIVDAMRKRLAPAADILTPNHWELETLADTKLPTLETTHAGARSFGKPVIVTSAPSAQGVGVLYASPAATWLVETPKIASAPKGAGDLFTALFIARRALGQSVVMALEAAAGATHDVIARSALEGGPHLALIDAQEKLEHPDTWPTATPYKG
ncbi:MAG: pyridoxal kinase [Hyphomonadaceae bacterium]|nr:MAG: pyridoxine kinase [Caulobacteraceae bacterium]MBT9446324.1 pyridoxal kinase [Hyphomonadaceae bacterium]TPW07988.1 MAG: pyridoxine kinase [Alphaproteobacteria bacterium]